MQTIKVRTTPDEIAKCRTIKETLSIYRAKVDAANEALKAAYKAAIREIEEINRRKPLAETLADIDSGKHWENLRKQFNAAGVTAEAYAVSELCKCDIYVNGDQIAWEVMQVFPEVNKRQVLTWLCQHAEDHHEVCGAI